VYLFQKKTPSRQPPVVTTHSPSTQTPCQKAPRNVKEYEGIQSRVNECDSTERKLSRVGKTSAIYTQQRAFESRPKESYQSEYGPEYAENRNLNSFKQVPCTASPSGRQAEQLGRDSVQI